MRPLTPTEQDILTIVRDAAPEPVSFIEFRRRLWPGYPVRDARISLYRHLANLRRWKQVPIYYDGGGYRERAS